MREVMWLCLWLYWCGDSASGRWYGALRMRIGEWHWHAVVCGVRFQGLELTRMRMCRSRASVLVESWLMETLSPQFLTFPRGCRSVDLTPSEFSSGAWSGQLVFLAFVYPAVVV
ncbi:hypothetical protein M758_3G191200 [Ceratodon purpureus]|nr:hypothetical protein M758_3G191200 [Ceratodon purpureus]